MAREDFILGGGIWLGDCLFLEKIDQGDVDAALALQWPAQGADDIGQEFVMRRGDDALMIGQVGKCPGILIGN